MQQHIFPAIKLTLLSIIVFVGAYTLLILGIAQAAPNKGHGEVVTSKGKVVGYKLLGQSFTNDAYFNGRPSAVGYNAAGSGGSNKGPSNPDYLKQVQNRIDTFLVHNPGIKKEQIPAELITASGSGLDPDISPEAARIQIARIAVARNIPSSILNQLVAQQTIAPLAGCAGTSKINVLQLNLALDQLKP